MQKYGKYGEKAKHLFESGYNCAQAVTLAFAEEMEMEPEMAARIASSFGGGVGRMREICGCVSGMAIVAGELYGYSDPGAGEEKAACYARIQKLAGEFRREAGSILCRELLEGITADTAPTPEKRSAEYYKRRPCADLTAQAADILGREMEE